MTKAGRTNAKINNSKYFSNSDVANVGVEVDDVDAVLALYILCPKMNDDVPIKNETIPRIFPERLGIILIGNPCLVNCDWVCCCALTALLSVPRNNSSIANDDRCNKDQIKCIDQVPPMFFTFIYANVPIMES
jgi:hypothetical protein